MVVDRAYNPATEVATSDNLDCINLVRWPIKNLTFEDGTPLLIEISTNACTFEDGHMDAIDDPSHEFVAGEKSIFIQKRTYCMVNRKPRVLAPKDSNIRTSMDSISHVATIDCCQDKCCQIANREAIHQLRKYLWGLDLEDHTNYVYDMLESSCRIDSVGTRKYTCVFNEIGRAHV